MPRRPRILHVMAGRLAPQVLPACGHPRVRTPHLDRLAEIGWDFQPMRDASRLHSRESGDIQASCSGTVP